MEEITELWDEVFKLRDIKEGMEDGLLKPVLTERLGHWYGCVKLVGKGAGGQGSMQQQRLTVESLYRETKALGTPKHHINFLMWELKNA